VTYQINQEVVWLESDQEIRLYNADSGEFLTLSSTATEIWQLAVGGKAAEDIISLLVEKYADGNARDGVHVRREIVGFLEALVARGVFVERAEGPQVAT
jgi:hypothetical protein